MKTASHISRVDGPRDGIVQGIVLSAVLVALEVLVTARAAQGAFGGSLSGIAAVYVGTGAVAGLLTGLAAGLIGRAGGVPPARLSLPVLAWFFGALFVLRRVPLSAFAGFPARLVAVLAAGGVALFVAWWWARRAPRARAARSRRRRLALGAPILLAVGVIAWEPVSHHTLRPRGTAHDDAPNILFILVDALRADRVSAFGYPRATTPNLDRLAAEGVWFSNAYAHGNRTIISMPAIFTSMYPALTGAYAFQDKLSPLPDEQVTIAELCRSAGYTTFAMMSNPFLKRPFGLTQGFDRVEEFQPARFSLSVYRLLIGVGVLARPHYAEGSASATEVTDAALAWLRRTPRGAPFFCYVHYMDVHHPYVPPPQFERMFRSRESLASIDPRALFARTVEVVHARTPYPLDDDELTRLGDLYDGCIRYVDTEIDRLFDAVRQADNGRPTVIVFTSDHGDEFQEKGCLYHNNVVIQELIRVPLVVWRSDRPFRREVTDLVRHVDLLPTLAEWVGAAPPAQAIGRSLVPQLTGVAMTPVTSIAEGDYCSALVEPGWKVMHVDTSGVDALFDLSADPWAGTDVSRAHPDRWTRLRDDLDEYLRTVEPLRARPSATASAETLRQLRTLGYIN